ncbi:MAG: TRAP transporter small permease [Planctomycetes bacterium]|nr:TRAP transporter small permease [Planctomycetota bacterium]
MMFDRIEWVFRKVDVVFTWLSALILAGMTGAIFLQVICRYILRSSLAWSEELSRFLFIWMTFIAAYVGARQGKHIGVEALQNALPRIPATVLRCLANLVCTAFFFIVAYCTIQAWPKLMRQVSPALGLPIAFVYLCMIIGSTFIGLYYLVLALHSARPTPAAPAAGKGETL